MHYNKTKVYKTITTSKFLYLPDSIASRNCFSDNRKRPCALVLMAIFSTKACAEDTVTFQLNATKIPANSAESTTRKKGRKERKKKKRVIHFTQKKKLITKR